jgi:hypothetical protein
MEKRNLVHLWMVILLLAIGVWSRAECHDKKVPSWYGENKVGSGWIMTSKQREERLKWEKNVASGYLTTAEEHEKSLKTWRRETTVVTTVVNQLIMTYAIRNWEGFSRTWKVASEEERAAFSEYLTA